jgi:hypothetical protein
MIKTRRVLETFRVFEENTELESRLQAVSVIESG